MPERMETEGLYSQHSRMDRHQTTKVRVHGGVPVSANCLSDLLINYDEHSSSLSQEDEATGRMKVAFDMESLEELKWHEVRHAFLARLLEY